MRPPFRGRAHRWLSSDQKVWTSFVRLRPLALSAPLVTPYQQGDPRQSAVIVAGVRSPTVTVLGQPLNSPNPPNTDGESIHASFHFPHQATFDVDRLNRTCCCHGRVPDHDGRSAPGPAAMPGPRYRR